MELLLITLIFVGLGLAAPAWGVDSRDGADDRVERIHRTI